jgi:16S rRNA (cytosine1402-N4)-methyltransferase
MSTFAHTTVLREEATRLLAPGPGRCVLDGTLGGGGHSEALLEAGATVIGLDQDPAALAAARTRLARFGDRFTAVHANFRDARAVLDARGIALVDGAIVDLGVSSPQLDEAARGFSFSHAGPLDMRMDPGAGVPLSEWLDGVDARELERVIRDYGEEPQARRVARAVCEAHAAGRLGDTRALAEVVAGAIPRATWPKLVHPATRTFQALRIAVNDELGALNAWLDALPDLVAPGGRACVIAFHSLEDRPVKQRFAELTRGCICPPDMPVCGCGRAAGWRLLTRKPVSAGEDEIAANPRSRSARLRCVERLFSKVSG